MTSFYWLFQGEENCRSFISDNSDGQNGIENSFYSQSDLPSQEASSDDDNSYDKSSTSWDEFRSKEDSEKDEREKLDTDMNFMSLR